MSDRKAALMQQMAPKWGDEAAEYRWKMRRIQLAGLPLAIVVVCALLLRSSTALAWALLGLFCVCAVPLAVLMLVYVRRMNRAASRTLGVKVNWKAEHSPPQKSPAYEEWCTKNGLTPYAASEHYGRGKQPSGSRPS